jgi:hypothetical protein
MEITNKKSVYQHIYLILNFIKIIRILWYMHIYFNINHYENKIGYYKHHENKLGYYKHRYFFLSYFMKIN